MQRIGECVEFARNVGTVHRDDQARRVWAEVYPKLSDGRPGLLGAATSRAEAQVMRLATIYALLDKSAVVRAEHLMAALAVWEYAEQSAKYIFGSALGDPTADAILRALREHPEGMDRTAIRELLPAAQRRRGNQPSPQRAGRGRPGAQRVTGGHGRTPAGGLVCPYIDLRQKRSKRGKGQAFGAMALWRTQGMETWEATSILQDRR